MDLLHEARNPFIREEVLSILSSMGEGIVISDANHNVVFMNRAAETLLQVKESDFLGKSIWSCHRNPAKVGQATEKAKTQPMHYDASCPELDKSFKLSIAAVKGANGEFRGTAMIIHDFTQEKKLRDELTESNQQLRQNQDRLDFQLKIAAEIQKALLPANVNNRHFAFWGEVHQTVNIGGDFYVYLPSKNHNIFMALGDIVGKGVPAALIMTMVMNYLTASALEYQHPVEVVENLNYKMLNLFKAEMYASVSLFALNFNPLSGELNYTGAAFEAPILLKANGDTQLLETVGFPVGSFDNGLYSRYRTRMDKGDRLVLFTDGVIDARNAHGEFFNYKRWYPLVEAKRTLKGKKFLSALTREIMKFSKPGPLSDDFAVLVLEKK